MALLSGLFGVVLLVSILAAPSLAVQAAHAEPPRPDAPGSGAPAPAAPAQPQLAQPWLAQPGLAPIPPPGVVSLVRIDVPDLAGLRMLAEMRVKIYLQMAGPDGETIVLLPANASLRTSLAQRGFAVQVLDVDIGQASYYLLYGLPETLAQVQDQLPVLLASQPANERQMLVRATAEQIDALQPLGLRAELLATQAVSLLGPAFQPSLALDGATTGSPVVQGMVDQVLQADLQLAVERLSGERPVKINGVTTTLSTRYTWSEDMIRLATRYAYETLRGYGLKTSFDPYIFLQQSDRRNVIAEQTGLTQPDRIFLLTAHLDSTSTNPWALAPGADDNASGTVAVMEAARILSQYDFGCTLRYALFTGEEQGLYGSADYGDDVRAQGENVQGVINLDMLGYNTPGTPATFELHARRGNSSDLAIANLFSEAVQVYGLGLTPQVLDDGMRFSDHAAFWDRGYPAILVIEDWDDHTPHYHRLTDQVENMNFPYYTELVKAAIASFAHMGCLLDGQVSGVVRAASQQTPLVGAQVEAWQNGQRVRAVKTGKDGSYDLPLQPGPYSLKFSAAGYQTVSEEAVTVVKDAQVTRSRELQVCDTVQAPVFVFGPLDPEIQQTVTFTASVSSGAQPLTYSWTFGDSAAASGPQVTHSYSQPGLYTVTLSVDNTCAYPQTVTGNLGVGLTVLYVPIIRK